MTDSQPLCHPLIVTDRRCATIPPHRHTIIGALIRQRRETLGLSQTKLAEMLDVDHAHISRIEGGTRYPDTSKVPALAAALDLPPWSIACAIADLDPATVRDAMRAELTLLIRAEVLATVTAALGDGGERDEVAA